MWYILENPHYPNSIHNKYALTDASLSNLHGYEKKVAGYETWTILAQAETEAGIMKRFNEMVKTGEMKNG